jgi:predicted ribosomally synthesized peptide with SipW-like signal peptide
MDQRQKAISTLTCAVLGGAAIIGPVVTVALFNDTDSSFDSYYLLLQPFWWPTLILGALLIAAAHYFHEKKRKTGVIIATAMFLLWLFLGQFIRFITTLFFLP